MQPVSPVSRVSTIEKHIASLIVGQHVATGNCTIFWTVKEGAFLGLFWIQKYFNSNRQTIEVIYLLQLLNFLREAMFFSLSVPWLTSVLWSFLFLPFGPHNRNYSCEFKSLCSLLCQLWRVSSRRTLMSN